MIGFFICLNLLFTKTNIAEHSLHTQICLIDFHFRIVCLRHSHKIIAVLHDVLEDTETSIEDLQALGFQPHIIEAIVALTKQKGESRIQAAQRTVQNPLARVVKLADINDNMDLSRISSPTSKDFERLNEYQQVRDILIQNV